MLLSHRAVMRSLALSFAAASLLLACQTRPGVLSGEETSEGARRVVMSVTEAGFEPDTITVKASQPLELVITRKTDATCATEIIVDDPPVNQKLPLNETVTVRFTPTKAGELRFGCAMDKMIGGKIFVQ